MFFEQYSHEPYVATPRFIKKHFPADSPRQAELPKRLAQGRVALAVMDAHLKNEAFFVAGRYTIADIALYAYTHVAPEGGLDLAPYRNVRAWVDRVASQARHVPLTRRP
jgi:glutathione S-transferase